MVGHAHSQEFNAARESYTTTQKERERERKRKCVFGRRMERLRRTRPTGGRANCAQHKASLFIQSSSSSSSQGLDTTKRGEITRRREERAGKMRALLFCPSTARRDAMRFVEVEFRKFRASAVFIRERRSLAAAAAPSISLLSPFQRPFRSTLEQMRSIIAAAAAKTVLCDFRTFSAAPLL